MVERNQFLNYQEINKIYKKNQTFTSFLVYEKFSLKKL